jgi:glycosyltransferase involved in cell wall biosynthesis
MKKSVAIVCSRLDLQGGIERASVNLAHLFLNNGHKVSIIILDCTAKLFYTVDERITIVQENLHFGITQTGNMATRKIAFLHHIVKLRKIYKGLRPDYIISTEYSLTVPTVFAAKDLSSKLIGWEHHHFYWMQKNKFWSLLFRYAYPKLDKVVNQNKAEKKLFENIGCKAVAIPYVTPQQKITAPLDNKVILSIGWLIKRKGVDLIPEIAEKIFKQFPNWSWKIIGEGEEYTSLKEELEKRGIEKNIVIQKPGSPAIEKEYLNASVFVLLSRFECLPLVLLEATSFGVPCIAFDCSTGPAFIINDKVDGLLIEQDNTDAMAEAIISLISNNEKRKMYGEAAHQNNARFSPENVYARWEELFVEFDSERTRK